MLKPALPLNDGAIIIWREKFLYNLGRPITYINYLIDPGWQSYYSTPPYPEYPAAGLSEFYSSTMQVLIREFDDNPITDYTYTWRGVPPRYYSSISNLTLEVASSRVYEGVHYQFTMDHTREMGRKLGNQIADINLSDKK